MVKYNEILEEERGIEMAGRALLTVSRNERERARLMSEYKYITDNQSKMVHAVKLAERRGIKKGRAEGRAEGKAEGIFEGKAEGKAETREADVREFLSQLKSGKSVDEIIKIYS